jgi:phospholipid-translocating ATPase
MPEGVPPASGILQTHMENIFSGFEEWTIVIFDNLLVLATNYEDAYHKVELILNRCKDRNLVLKFSKTWLGFNECEFFGYKCVHNKYELTEKRKNSINSWQWPTTKKQMQGFLGTALFFKSFVPMYAEYTAPLYDCTKENFNWSPDSWKVNYIKCFQDFKEALVNATALFFPDYNLLWLLRCDASGLSVGYVLLQVKVNDDGSIVLQPIMFGSKKLSDAATRWSSYDLECYAVVFAVKDCEYYLRGKPFQLETDHRNLLWMERSEVPRVIRWRVYLQGFSFTLNHIPGKQNIVADWLSRFNMICTIIDVDPNRKYSRNEMLKSCHGARAGHFGVRNTWKLLNKYFPGHGISHQQVCDFVSECGVCQKVRLGMQDALLPMVRHLKNEAPRKVVGADFLSLEEDKYKMSGVYVLRDHFTHHVGIYPVSTPSAENFANSLFMHCVNFGKFDILITDPGTEFRSDAIQLLNTWFGIHHRVSLVDRHESNGVEAANREILRHIRALICDERVYERWSSPSVIGWITYLLNDTSDAETGSPPYHLMFGTSSVRYFDFPSNSLDTKTAPAYLKHLDEDLRILREISSKYQQGLVVKRTKLNGIPNQYQSGDLILYQYPTDKPLPHKLLIPYAGPYEVIQQIKNDIECRHVSHGVVKKFHVDEVKLFFGTKDEAYNLAMTDANQYVVDVILAYRGDPLMRTTMEFLVKFQDGSEHWKPWDNDLFDTTQYEDFCLSKPPLFPLILRLKESQKRLAEINKTPITAVKPGDTVYVDLRCYGANWYQNLRLPDCDFKTYVVVYTYTRWIKPNIKIEAVCDIFKETFPLDHVFVKMYGSVFTFDESLMVLIDEDFVSRHPQVLP